MKLSKVEQNTDTRVNKCGG